MADKKIKIRMIRGLAGTTPKQRANMQGLGLKKINQERELGDTPATRGMIKVVKHLVEVSE